MLSKRYTYKFEFVGMIVGILFLVLIMRLVYMQVFEGDAYKRKADGNRIRITSIMAPRGIFYDRKGDVLATNRPGFTVSLIVTKGKINEENLGKLSKILNIPSEEILSKVSKNTELNRVVVKTDVSAEIVTMLEERKRDFPDVLIEVQPIRIYTHNQLAAHVIGYVGDINENELERLKDKGYLPGSVLGKMGLEKKYDEFLRGKDGANRVEVDVSGNVVDTLGKEEPIPGYNVQLTIDAELQKVAEQALDAQMEYLRKHGGSPNAFAGALVAIDPNTGAILAMVSRPSFNPNLFSTGISYKDWREINENPFHPMDNKAISGEYPPGSSFKIVTAATALETGKVTPGELYYDRGYHPLVPEKGNDEGKALGSIDLRTALAKSDNVYFYEMGLRTGIDKLEEFARKFGFGTTTGINLDGESEGVVASRDYKRRVFDEDWYLAETFDATIGQGFQLATPIQLAVATASVANGGIRYKPYLIDKILDNNGKIVKEFKKEKVADIGVSKSNLAAIALGLRGVAQAGGTGQQLKDFPVPIAGKTGTAENPHGKDHGIFVGYAPFDNPSIVVAIIIDQGGYASMSVVPVARKIFAAAFGIKE